jgi:hypothetical protein
MNEKQAETKIKRTIRKRSLDIGWTNATKYDLGDKTKTIEDKKEKMKKA